MYMAGATNGFQAAGLDGFRVVLIPLITTGVFYRHCSPDVQPAAIGSAERPFHWERKFRERP